MLLARCLLSIFCTIFYVIVTTLSGVGYASVNEQATLDIVVTNLFHDSCSLVEASDCSFTVGLLLISAKGHLQSIGQVWRSQGVTASRLCPPVGLVALVGMVVRTRKCNALRRNAYSSVRKSEATRLETLPN